MVGGIVKPLRVIGQLYRDDGEKIADIHITDPDVGVIIYDESYFAMTNLPPAKDGNDIYVTFSEVCHMRATETDRLDVTPDVGPHDGALPPIADTTN